MSPWPGSFAITLIALVLFCAIAVAIDSYKKRKIERELKSLERRGYLTSVGGKWVPTAKALRELEQQ